MFISRIKSHQNDNKLKWFNSGIGECLINIRTKIKEKKQYFEQMYYKKLLKNVKSTKPNRKS